MPAHVTVLYPFVDTDDLTDALHDELVGFVAGFGAFHCTFAAVGRFPDVTYLVPEPEAAFRELTAAVHSLWPDHPPYEGAFDDVVPHLTLAQTDDAATLDAVAAAIAASLPIGTDVAVVELWAEHTDGIWRKRWRFPLDGASGAG